jgi:acetoin utilization protein AcuC
MVNPLAGFHHASRDSSSGFCFFNDIAVAIEYLREIYMLKRFLIIDLDVHHCNGTQDIYYADPTVLTVSFHQDGRTLYPGTGSMDETGQGEGIGYTVNLPFPPGTGDRSYLYAFDEIIPCLTHEFNPEVIIYQSGVDTHHSDPLAGLNLTFQTYHHLAKKIIELSRSTCNRLLVLFGGGYNSDSSVKSYFNIMCGFLDRDDYLEEKSTDESNQKYVERIVRDLKIKIGEYWSLK